MLACLWREVESVSHCSTLSISAACSDSSFRLESVQQQRERERESGNTAMKVCTCNFIIISAAQVCGGSIYMQLRYVGEVYTCTCSSGMWGKYMYMYVLTVSTDEH